MVVLEHIAESVVVAAVRRSPPRDIIGEILPLRGDLHGKFCITLTGLEARFETLSGWISPR